MRKKKIAARYNNNLKDLREINIQYVSPEAEHVYHLYVIKTSKREELVKFLLKNEIQTGIHYPIPPHLQKAYSELGFKKGDFPIAEQMSKTCLSLPLYPGLTFEEVDLICDRIKEFYR